MIDGKVQSFPLDTWKEEFSLAKECGFEFLEWVLDLTNIESNPVLSNEGRKEINKLKKEYDVEVPIICADYFMNYSFHSKGLDNRLRALGMLVELINVCPEVGIHQIEIPLLGESAIENESDEILFLRTFNHCLPLIEKQDVYLLLETSLIPERIKLFLDRISSNRIKLNYDTGNSAYWGYDVEQEMSAYGKEIGNIHIKDCTPEDYSVPLGQGNVDFDLTFKLLRQIGYKGDFVLQTCRGEDDIKLANEFKAFTQTHISRYLYES